MTDAESDKALRQIASAATTKAFLNVIIAMFTVVVGPLLVWGITTVVSTMEEHTKTLTTLTINFSQMKDDVSGIKTQMDHIYGYRGEENGSKRARPF